MKYRTYTLNGKETFLEGMRSSVPIAMGYFAVSFALGINAKLAGLTPFQSGLASLLSNASAGEYAEFNLIAASAPIIELIIMTLVVNARYFLMGCAMSQHAAPDTSFLHRLFMGFFITDEFFACSVARPGYLNPYYTLGLISLATPAWALGTALGCAIGNIMPLRLVSAFSVALYGMFFAIIIPPARKDRIIAGVVVLCFAASWCVNKLSLFAFMSGGTKTIVLTVLISAAAALLFPHNEEENKQEEAHEN